MFVHLGETNKLERLKDVLKISCHLSILEWLTLRITSGVTTAASIPPSAFIRWFCGLQSILPVAWPSLAVSERNNPGMILQMSVDYQIGKPLNQASTSTIIA
jgi:hypothetical protein